MQSHVSAVVWLSTAVTRANINWSFFVWIYLTVISGDHSKVLCPKCEWYLTTFCKSWKYFRNFGNSYLSSSQGVHFWESFWQIKCLVLSSQQYSRILLFVRPSRAVRFCTWDFESEQDTMVLIWISFNWSNIGIISDCRDTDTIEQREWKKFEDAFPCLCHLSIPRYRPDVK